MAVKQNQGDKKINSFKSLSAVMLLSVCLAPSAQADWWDKTKEVASDAWSATKEGAADAWDATKDAASDGSQSVKQEWNREDNPDEAQLSDVKKLADKETYVKAWEGIKQSAQNPEEPSSDEHGIPY